MSKIFTLDSFREEAEKEFSPVQISLGDGTIVKLKSLLRLNKKARESVLAQIDLLNAKSDAPEGEESEGRKLEDLDNLVEAATKILEAAADQPKALLKELDGDLMMLMAIIKEWMGSTQPGEAESSPA